MRGCCALVIVILLAACGSAQSPTGTPREPGAGEAIDYPTECKRIADELEVLDRQFPQMADYRSVDAHHDCRLSYEHHTHRSRRAGGWSAEVPNPDPDGVWFHIGLWDPNDPREANAQINTQPMLPDWWIGERRVTFLILEGEHTKSVADAIIAVLKRHHLREHR
jgi:hypothetical protein